MIFPYSNEAEDYGEVSHPVSPSPNKLFRFASGQQEIGDELCLLIGDFGLALHFWNFLLPMGPGVLLGQVQVVTTSAVIGVQGTAYQ